MLAMLLRGTDPFVLAMAQVLRHHALQHMPTDVLRPTVRLLSATAEPNHALNRTTLPLKPHIEPTGSPKELARATESHSQAAWESKGSSPDPSMLPTPMELLRTSGIEAMIEHLKTTQLTSTEESALPSAASHLPALDAGPELQYTAAGANEEIAKLPVYSHREQLLNHIAANRVTCIQGNISRRCSLLSSPCILATHAAPTARNSPKASWHAWHGGLAPTSADPSLGQP
jgi:hypothetical protein